MATHRYRSALIMALTIHPPITIAITMAEVMQATQTVTTAPINMVRTRTMEAVIVVTAVTTQEILIMDRVIIYSAPTEEKVACTNTAEAQF